MEPDEIKENEKTNDFLSAIFILQASFVCIVLVVIYVLKTFLPSIFSPVKAWITERFYQNTSVEQIFQIDDYSSFSENDYSVY